MSRKKTILVLVVLVICVLPLTSVLANTIFFPTVHKSEPTPTATTAPTPTVIPPPQILILDFNVAASASDEYVEIYNSTSAGVDMTFWTLSAQTGQVFIFPNNFVLGGGDVVRVWSGAGANTSTDLYWGSSNPIWVTLGNCAFIKNPDQITVDSACVPPVYFSDYNPSTIPQNDYITIQNNTSTAIDMTGWWMKAESESGRYDFPAGFVLGPLAAVNVHSGVGFNTATDLYIGLSYSLWTIQSNCAYLRYSDGTLLDSACVP